MIRRRTLGGVLVAGLFALWTSGCSRHPAQGAPSPGPPQRIVSQVVDSDEILHALGPQVQSRVVGVSTMADDARYSTIAGLWPPAVPRVPGTSEALIAARPDLVILASFSAPQTRALLEGSGIETLTLEGFDGFDDYEARVRLVAKTVGVADGGEALVSAFRARLPPSRNQAGPTVLSYVAGNVAGAGTSFNDICTAAGLRNVAATEGVVGHKPVSIEQIVVWDPDFFVIECAADCGAAVANIKDTAGLSALSATRNDHIVAIESRQLLSSGATMADVAITLQRATAER